MGLSRWLDEIERLTGRFPELPVQEGILRIRSSRRKGELTTEQALKEYANLFFFVHGRDGDGGVGVFEVCPEPVEPEECRRQKQLAHIGMCLIDCYREDLDSFTTENTRRRLFEALVEGGAVPLTAQEVVWPGSLASIGVPEDLVELSQESPCEGCEQLAHDLTVLTQDYQELAAAHAELAKERDALLGENRALRASPEVDKLDPL